MRVAIIASLLPGDTKGGAERYVRLLSLALARDHEVAVLSGSRRPELDGIPVIRLPRLPQLEEEARLPARVLWHALDQWLPHVHVAVARELKRLAPDVVSTHHPQGMSAAVFTGVASSGVPHVHTAHDLNLLCARTSMTRDGRFCGGGCASCRIQRAIRGRAARLSLARLIGVSNYICRRHVEGGIVESDRAVTIRLGARPGTKRVRRADDAVALGFIGTLAPHKGILTLLHAFDQADASLRLVIAGSGPCEPDVVAAAERNPRVRYVGHVEAATKDAFFDELDVLVIPSEWEEPATFVAVEAAVRGIPSVVSDRGGLPETPESCSFRSGDPIDLLRAVRSFVDEPERLEQASTRLIEQSQEFEWDRHMRDIERLLDDVVAERRAPDTALSSPAR
jgi:glycosyltransferase involved in cell wall biosynthesis